MIIGTVLTGQGLCVAVRAMWHRTIEECVRIGPRRWRVHTVAGPAQAPPEQLVAKWIPDDRRERALGGLAVAAHVAALGIDSGEPVPAVDGALAVSIHGGLLTLLRPASGRRLDPTDPIDQQFWGDLLGRVHRATATYSGPAPVRLGPLDPHAAHLRLEPWLRPAVADATSALLRLTVSDQLTYGVVHGDPQPGACRIDRDTGRMSLVGWGWAASGLLLYDVANAVGYIGGIDAAGEFLDGYLAAGPLHPGEVAAGLPVILRCRWARRADACARALHAGTSEDPDADRAALEQAREALVGSAV